MRPPPGHVGCAEAAKAAGISASLLRVWETRHGWPNPIRDSRNGYRWYSPMLINNLKAFNLLGRPFKQIKDGAWYPPPNVDAKIVAAMASADDTFRSNHAQAGVFLVEALIARDDRVVREWLASMGRIHPFARGHAIAAIRASGWCKDLMRYYGIPE